MISVAHVRATMAGNRPVVLHEEVKARASVALVVAPAGGDCQLLMIERADVEGDRWSGQIAFPGGRADTGDLDLAATAERETHEELGVVLERAALLGRLDDLAGHRESIIVSAFVYAVPEAPALRPSYEVKRGFWRTFAELSDSGNHVELPFEYAGQTSTLPALHVVPEPSPALWGLSYRFLELLMDRVGRPIPAMTWADPETQR